MTVLLVMVQKMRYPMSKKIPDDMGKFMELFTKLCEKYADEADTPHNPKIRGKAETELLNFCHGYAYKVNGVEEWK